MGEVTTPQLGSDAHAARVGCGTGDMDNLVLLERADMHGLSDGGSEGIDHRLNAGRVS